MVPGLIHTVSGTGADTHRLRYPGCHTHHGTRAVIPTMVPGLYPPLYTCYPGYTHRCTPVTRAIHHPGYERYPGYTPPWVWELYTTLGILHPTHPGYTMVCTGPAHRAGQRCTDARSGERTLWAL